MEKMSNREIHLENPFVDADGTQSIMYKDFYIERTQYYRPGPNNEGSNFRNRLYKIWSTKVVNKNHLTKPPRLEKHRCKKEYWSQKAAELLILEKAKNLVDRLIKDDVKIEDA